MKIITLCGSTKFEKEFMDVQRDLTIKGNVVLSVGVFGHSRDYDFFNKQQNKKELKKRLDQIHLKKIDLADEIFVINKNGYIGESTRNEINYAKKQGKKINYLYKKRIG